MAVMRVATRCQVVCSCGKVANIRPSVIEAVRSAQILLAFHSDRPFSAWGTEHQLIEQVWLNIGRKTSAASKPTTVDHGAFAIPTT